MYTKKMSRINRLGWSGRGGRRPRMRGEGEDLRRGGRAELEARDGLGWVLEKPGGEGY